jgi:hypothetical protein
MEATFDIVYRFLVYLSVKTSLSYEEINIIVYYIVTPLIYVVMIDRIFRFHYFKIIFTLAVALTFIFMESFYKFSMLLFIKSQNFLLGFKIIGWNYTEASVIICVVFPALLFVALIFLLYRKRYSNRYPLIVNR